MLRTTFLRALGASTLLAGTGAGCTTPPPPPTQATAVAPGTTTAGPPEKPAPVERATPPRPAARPARSPDVALVAPVGLNLTDLRWEPAPARLPVGAQMALLEGEPPFAGEQSYTIAVKLPPGYRIPPYLGVVTERLTVLQGRLHVGHGAQVDRTATKELTRGGLVLMPAHHPHYAYTTTDEAVVLLQGVGPWEMVYVDPADDPRPRPPAPPAGYVGRFDAPVGPKILNADEIAFAPAPPGMLPPGAQLAILDGDPAKNQNFVLRIKVPAGYRFPVHSHSVTDRPVVLSGALRFGMGDRWQPAAMTVMKPGAIGIFPAGNKHYAQATTETVFQVTGTGPFDLIWANPEDDPARQLEQQARARP